MTAPNLLGVRFGKLIVLLRSENDKGGSTRWLCRCDCGQTRTVAGTGLRAGRNKSCGCASPRFTSARSLTHGLSRTRTYRIWLGMLRRCQPGGRKPHLYYDKGIRVCDRWQDFPAFVEDMGLSPAGLTIDRVDGNLGYQPGNCRWTTRKVQANNMSSNRIVVLGGRKLTLSQAAEASGIKANTLLYRLRRGWQIEEAVAVPVQKRMTA